MQTPDRCKRRRHTRGIMQLQMQRLAVWDEWDEKLTRKA